MRHVEGIGWECSRIWRPETWVCFLTAAMHGWDVMHVCVIAGKVPAERGKNVSCVKMQSSAMANGTRISYMHDGLRGHVDSCNKVQTVQLVATKNLFGQFFGWCGVHLHVCGFSDEGRGHWDESAALTKSIERCTQCWLSLVAVESDMNPAPKNTWVRWKG